MMPIRGPLPDDTARTAVLVAMLTIAIYMSFLVDLRVLTMFKRRNTLYFWALLVTSWGIMSHSLGVILEWFVGSCPWEVYTAFTAVGWWGMVTGQSLVLYSRLHLVVRSPKILRAVLLMIIVDFFLFQIPTTVQKFISTHMGAGKWLTVFHVYERIQLIVFTVQELIISIIYIRATVIWLSPSDPEGMRHTKQFLIYLNILCIALDIAIVGEVFGGQWEYEEATQSLAYAIKLTLEFAVLNKVMEMYRFGPGRCTSCHRRFALSSLGDLSEPSGGRTDMQFSTKAKHDSSAPIRLASPWLRSKPEGSERLGSSDGKAMAEDMLAADAVREARIGSTTARLDEKDTGRGVIVVTTGITTHYEGRHNDDHIISAETS